MLCYLEVPWHFSPRAKDKAALKQAFALPLAVIGGEWHFFVIPNNPNAYYDSFSYGVVWTGARGRFSVEEAKLVLWSTAGVVLSTRALQGAGSFPSADDGRLEAVNTSFSQGAYGQFTLKLCISCPEDTSSQLLPGAGRYTTLLDDMHPNNLALVFRRGTLWTNSKALAEASPYFRHLLDSGFEEGTARTANDEMGGVRARDVHAELDFDDSDDESAGDTAPKSGSPSSSPVSQGVST